MFPPYQTLIANLLEGTVALIALNRPDAANAMNTQMGQELSDVFNLIAADGSVRAVILTGQGKHFCAGADLKERKGIDTGVWQQQHHVFEKAMWSIAHCPIPVIAAINGAAYGGGLEIALACDFIYASYNARFALTEATLGIMPGLGGSQRLPRLIGMNVAKEYLFTGKTMSAEDAYRLGLVNQLCDPALLLDDASYCARTIAGNAPLSVRAIKQAAAEGALLAMDEAHACELKYYNNLLESRDRQEGINAFNQKRKPVFTGE